MHSVAKETAKELQLPFRVTVSFAPQRFLSSSYHQFLKLEQSIEVYIETFKDHNNSQVILYQIAGQDFLFDLMGMLDLLWPLVLLQLRGQSLIYPGWKFKKWITMALDQLKVFNQEVVRKHPRKSICPYIHKHGKEIANMKYGKSDLVDGWLIVEDTVRTTERDSDEDEDSDEGDGGSQQESDETNENSSCQGEFQESESDDCFEESESDEEDNTVPTTSEPTVIWNCRTIQDCKNDLSAFALVLHDKLAKRCSKMPELIHLLSQCLDFSTLFGGLCGEKTTGKCPIDRNSFAGLGLAAFRQCVCYVSALPHVQQFIQENELEMGNAFAEKIYWRLKSSLLEIIWGNKFVSLFPTFFKKMIDSKSKLAEIVLRPNATVTKFETAPFQGFDLVDKYVVTLSDRSVLTVVLQESKVIESLYNESNFYQSAGQEFCIIFDVLYSKMGTEIPAESFYKVVLNQEKDGGQDLDTLSMRARVDSCFPATIQCDRPVKEIAKLYLDGDKERGLKRHRIPVYQDRRSLKNGRKGMSKVITRHASSDAPLPFLL